LAFSFLHDEIIELGGKALDLLAQGACGRAKTRALTFGYRIEDGCPMRCCATAGATRSRGGWSSSSPSPLAAAHAPPDIRDDPALPPTKMLPNSHRILRLVTSAKWETSGMLRRCLVHPVAPLLSLLAPLFRPFFSPVRCVPDAAILRRRQRNFSACYPG
jgi:hypothetical protein